MPYSLRVSSIRFIIPLFRETYPTDFVPSACVESFQVGSVSLSMRWFPDDRFTADAFRAAQIAAGAELEDALDTFAPDRWEAALGSSGTVGAVSALLVANGITDGRITAPALRWCIARCIEAASVERLALPGLQADRKPVIGGGLALLYTLVTHFGIEALWPARGALRQGLIVELHERLSGRHRPGHADLRDDTVAELQHRFDVNLPHAARVRSVALPLLNAVMPRAGEEAVRELDRKSTRLNS